MLLNLYCNYMRYDNVILFLFSFFLKNLENGRSDEKSKYIVMNRNLEILRDCVVCCTRVWLCLSLLHCQKSRSSFNLDITF